MIVEYEISVPYHWDADLIEHQRNYSSWCCDNALDELKEFSEEHGCLCAYTEWDFIEDRGEPYLKECDQQPEAEE